MPAGTARSYCNFGNIQASNNGKVQSGEACAQVKTPAVSKPNLTVSKVVAVGDKNFNGATDTNAVVGDKLTYTLKYQNTGNGTAQNVTLTDSLTQNALQYINIDTVAPGGGTSSALDKTSRTITWHVGDVKAGTGGYVWFTATVPQMPAGTSRDYCNFGNIQATNNGPVQSNEACAHVKTPSTAPQLVISKVVYDTPPGGPPNPSGQNVDANVGDTLTYTISYQNKGTATAHGVVITDDLTQGVLGFIDISTVKPSNNGTVDATTRVITWNIGDVAPSSTPSTVSFTAIVPEIPEGTQENFCNLGVITSTETGKLESNQACAFVSRGGGSPTPTPSPIGGGVQGITSTPSTGAGGPGMGLGMLLTIGGISAVAAARRRTNRGATDTYTGTIRTIW